MSSSFTIKETMAVDLHGFARILLIRAIRGPFGFRFNGRVPGVCEPLCGLPGYGQYDLWSAPLSVPSDGDWPSCVYARRFGLVATKSFARRRSDLRVSAPGRLRGSAGSMFVVVQGSHHGDNLGWLASAYGRTPCRDEAV